MAYSYLRPNRNQPLLLPPDIRDWLPEDHLVWFVLEVVSMVDLAQFHKRHPNDGVGRRAYDPEMMLALLVYAYCTGTRSSRRIAAGCRTDLAMKVICCDVVPEHDAIGRFRANHEEAIKGAFTDVLMLCARIGLTSLGIVAIDGTKIGSDAALDANRNESAILAEVERILAEAKASDELDASQPALAGNVPEVPVRPAGRLARLQAALGEIRTERETRRKQEEARTTRLAEEAAQGRRPRGSAPKDPARALGRAQADLEAAKVRKRNARTTPAELQATEEIQRAKRSLCAAAKAAQAAPAPAEPQANTTDPESRIMKSASGWVQGYNAQAAVNEHQVVLAAVVTTDANDVGQLLPMITAVENNAATAHISGPVGIVLADAGYWSVGNATTPGPDRLIATAKDWKQRRAAREMGTTTGPAPEGASALETMEHRLRTEAGAAQYAKRSYTVEPIFGQIKENRNMRRFMRRGLDAASSEWSLICATTNILKMFVHADGRALAGLLLPEL